MAHHSVTGAQGVALHVAEHGTDSERAILFIHGWSQAELCWSGQYRSPALTGYRLLGLDLRGHGMSAKPLTHESYDGEAFADDIQAVLDRFRLERPILVGWSYGGFVIGDYVRKYGTARLGGVHFVGAALTLRPIDGATMIGPTFVEHAAKTASEDLGVVIAHMRPFIRKCTVAAMPAETFETVLAYNMVTPPAVRGFLINRDLDFTAELKALDRPTLITHGNEDTVVLPSMARFALDHCPSAVASWYEQVGHAPFMEAPERFNAELAAFAAEVWSAS